MTHVIAPMYGRSWTDYHRYYSIMLPSSRLPSAQNRDRKILEQGDWILDTESGCSGVELNEPTAEFITHP
jgi:hypothetical protein